jgi:3-oxoacyl-[acyl-carrier-protein] synthase-1
LSQRRGARVAGVGLVTPLGLGLRQTSASVRAGLSRACESALYDRRLEPFRLSLLPETALEPLDVRVDDRALSGRAARLLRLAAPALREASRGARGAAAPPLLLGLPEPVAGENPLGPSFVQALATQSGCAVDVKASRLFPDGRAAGLMAVRAGLQLLQSGAAREVLVGGADSFLEPGLLARLDAEERVLGARVADGFLPGEGAGFARLSTAAGDRSDDAWGSDVSGAEDGVDEGHLYSDEPQRGEGLAAVLAKLLPAAPRPVRTVFAGYNGESFWVKEWGVAFLRNRERFAQPVRFEHPADCFGDLGAALGPAMLALSVSMLKEGQIQGPCLVWASSDRAPRAAVLVDRPS